MRNKFESVQEIIQNTFDIFLFRETKIDSSFPSQQFRLPEYRIFRKDRKLMLCKLMDWFLYDNSLRHERANSYPMRQDFLALELKHSKTNWLIIVTYKPPSLSELY